MAHTCPNCGATGIPNEALRCPCGADLADDATPDVVIELVQPDAEPSHLDAPSPSGGGRRRVLRYAIGAVVVGLVAAFVVVSSGGDLDVLSVASSAVTTPTSQPARVSTTTSVTEPASTTTSITSTTTSITVASAPPASVTIPVDSAPAVPGAVAALLGEVGILDHDDFTGDLDRWDLVGYAGLWETLPGRIIVGTRTTTAGGGLRSNFAIEPGTAVVLRISYSVRTAAKTFLDSGTVGDRDYRRFGLRMGADWQPEAVVSEHYDGAVEITGFAPIGDLVPKAGNEYYVVLAVDDGGTLAFGVWPVDGFGYAIEIRDLGAPWAGRSWRVHAGVDEGILSVFEFWLVEYGGID